MNSFIVFKIVLVLNLYNQIHEDAGKYQVEANPHFEGKSLGSIFEFGSAENVPIPFINQVHNFESTESSILIDDENMKPRPKIKVRPKSKKLTSEEFHRRTKHKSIKKKHKKKGKKKMFVKTFVRDENNQTGSDGQKIKPFDIVVHIKVNEHDTNDSHE